MAKKLHREGPYSYRIIIERDGRTYHGYVPALRGCHSQGKTIEETKENLREAMRGYLKALLAHRQPIPKDDGIEMIETVAIDTRKFYAASSLR